MKFGRVDPAERVREALAPAGAPHYTF
jgi:hypothetical protein